MCALDTTVEADTGAPDADEHEGRGGPPHQGHDHSGHEEMFRRRFWVCLVLSIPVLVWSDTIQSWFGYTAPEFPGSELIVPVVSTFVFLYGGLPFLRMAGWELRGGGPGMMTLISLAITVAYTFSMATLIWSSLGEDFFWELVTLIVIMLLGHWLEMRSVRHASGALGALAKLMPDTAEVEDADGGRRAVGTDELANGDTVLVRPGARVPADGVIIRGRSDVDESMITGESRPVGKEPGATVIAGTVNTGSGTLYATVAATGEDTALAGIMRLVAEAEASRSPTQLFADRAASLLFYFAVGAALLAAVVWTAVEGEVNADVIARVVTVLVIACPHALGLAIPLVVSITTEIAASNGTLIRNREAIDTAKDLDTIAVDKTGTLTEGRVGLVGVSVVEGTAPEEAVALAAALEGESEHPLARALVDEAASRRLTRSPVEDFRARKGRGVEGVVDGHRVAVGGPRLLADLAVALPPVLADFAAEEGAKGRTVVHVVRDGRPIAAFALADVVRPESAAAVASLRERGIEVTMLTGDSAAVAAAVAADVGIDDVRSEVLPGDKDRLVGELQVGGAMVGMVGDGVNDAPALARADIGIAIGGGTDVAVQTADLVLVKSDPLDIVRIVELSAASYRKQIENVWWGAGYNVVMVPLAAGVLAPWGFTMPPAVGAVLMSLSTIVVALNAQTLRRVDLT